MKKIITYIFILAAIVFCANCANIAQMPMGGLKDTIAPVVLKAIPVNDSRNISPKRVELKFNEYVKAGTESGLSVSPPMKTQPIIKFRGKKIIIDIDSALNPETTYLFDFGNSIVDNNEGNTLEGYKLRFSTGNEIDSMHVSGRARDAFSYDSVADMKVFLYTKDVDSLPFTTIPDAVSNISKKGYFVAEALKSVPYRVVAVQDKNANYKYDDDEMVGFLDQMLTPVTYQADTMTVVNYEKDTLRTFTNLPLIRLFKENLKKQYLDRYVRDDERRVTLKFSQYHPEILKLQFIDNDSIALDSTKIIREKSYYGDSLTYWFAVDSVPAELRANLTYMKPNDSTGVDEPYNMLLKFKEFKKKKEDKKKKKKDDEEPEKPVTLKVSKSSNDNLITEQGLDLKFDAPLVKMDSSKIKIYINDEEGNRGKALPLKITPVPDDLCKYKLNTPKWEINTTYELELMPNAFKDIYALENDTITTKVTTPDPDKLSILKFDVKGAKCQYIIQLLKGPQIEQQKIGRTDSVVAFNFITPDTYTVRIIEDANNNGRWDTGSLKKRLQPERVKMYTLGDGSKELKLKEGWENEETLDLSKFFNDTPTTAPVMRAAPKANSPKKDKKSAGAPNPKAVKAAENAEAKLVDEPVEVFENKDKKTVENEKTDKK